MHDVVLPFPKKNPRIISSSLLVMLFFCACSEEPQETFRYELEVVASNGVNINKGTVAELSKIKGIGPSRAARIIEFRKEFGEFESISELMLVEGIGEKLFLKIRSEVSLR